MLRLHPHQSTVQYMYDVTFSPPLQNFVVLVRICGTQLIQKKKKHEILHHVKITRYAVLHLFVLVIQGTAAKNLVVARH